MKIKIVSVIFLIFVFLFMMRVYHLNKELKIITLENKRIERSNKNLKLNLFSPCKRMNICPFKNSNEEEKIKKVLSECENKLILRVTQSMCNTCYETEFNRLTSDNNSIDIKDVVIVTSFPPRAFMIFVEDVKNKLTPDVKILNINKKNINLCFEELNTPYYFVLNDRGLVESSFVPDKSIELHTFNYFNSIKTLFD